MPPEFELDPPPEVGSPPEFSEQAQGGPEGRWARDASGGYILASTGERRAPLPPTGWTEFQDEDDGELWWRHDITGEIVFDPPTDPVKKDPAEGLAESPANGDPWQSPPSQGAGDTPAEGQSDSEVVVVEDDDGLAEGDPETAAACFLFDPGEVDSALQYFHWPS